MFLCLTRTEAQCQRKFAFDLQLREKWNHSRRKSVKKKYRESNKTPALEQILEDHRILISRIQLAFHRFQAPRASICYFSRGFILVTWKVLQYRLPAPAVRVYWLQVSVETKVWMKCGWFLLKAAIMSHAVFIQFYHNHCWISPYRKRKKSFPLWIYINQEA